MLAPTSCAGVYRSGPVLKVNDSAEHAAGDALLRELASLILSMLRSGDLGPSGWR